MACPVGVGGIARQAHELERGGSGAKHLGHVAGGLFFVGIGHAAVPVVHEQVVKLAAGARQAGCVIGGYGLFAIGNQGVNVFFELTHVALEHIKLKRACTGDATAKVIPQRMDVVCHRLALCAIGYHKKLVGVLGTTELLAGHGRKGMADEIDAIRALVTRQSCRYPPSS